MSKQSNRQNLQLGEIGKSDGESALCKALGVPLTRRTFLSSTAVVGALTFLGQALGGRVQAFADEGGHTHFVIYVLSKEQVPVEAVDVSKPDTTNPEMTTFPRVPNVFVTIHSNTVPDKDLTVETNEDGFFPANVRALSLQRDSDSASTYYFFGSVKAVAPGWRSYHETLTLIEAGTPTDADGNRPNTIVIPTQPDDGKTPYLQGLMLDGSDIQYRVGQVVRVWKANLANSTFTFEVVTQSGGSRATCEILCKKPGASAYETLTGAKTETADAAGLAVVSFTGNWLGQIEVGSTIKAVFWVNDGDVYELELPEERLSFAAPLGAFVDDPMGENVQVSIGEPLNGSKGWKPMPDWLVKEGDSFLAAFPFIPISFFSDVYGNFGIAATLFTVDFLKRVNGENKLTGKDRFQAFGGNWGKKGWERWRDQTGEAIDGVCEAEMDLHEDESATFGKSSITSILAANFALEFWGFGNSTKDEELGGWNTSFDGAFNLKFSLSYGLSQPFVFANIPCYWTFDLAGALTGRVALGGKFHNKGDDLVWGHHQPWSKSGKGIPSFLVSFRLDAGLSVAFGVQGLLAAGIRGFAYLLITAVFDKVDGKAYPHLTISYGAGIDVFGQFTFFKKTKNLVKVSPKKSMLYDNWKKKSELEEALANVEALTDLDDTPFTPVSDADLADCVEKTGQRTAVFGIYDGADTPAYDDIPTLMNNSLTDAGYVDPFTSNDERYDPINGLKPSLQGLLWKDVYSNPRIRIIHTDAESFTNDRCFMLRLGVVAVQAPESTASFGTNAYASYEADLDYERFVDEEGNCLFCEGAWTEENGTRVFVPTGSENSCLPLRQSASNGADVLLGVEEDGNGNQFVRPLDQVTTPSNSACVYRTRVIICEWDKQNLSWGPGVPIDFTVDGEIAASDRLNTHDVDFDAELYDGNLLVAITSLMRPDAGEPLTPERYERNQYVSLVRWDIGSQFGAAMSPYSAGTTRLFNNKRCSLFYPRIVTQMFDGTQLNSGAKGIHCLVYSYMCHYDDGGNRQSSQIAFTVFDDMKRRGFAGHRLSTPMDITPPELNLTPDELVTGTIEVVCPDRDLMGGEVGFGATPSVAVFGWTRSGSDKATPSIVVSETFAVKQETDEETGIVTIKRYVHREDQKSFDSSFNLAKLCCIGQRGVFSIVPNCGQAHEGKATSQMITFDGATLKLGLIEDTGSTDKLRYFSSWNGRRLYTVRIMDSESVGGAGPVLSDEIQEALQKEGAVIAGTRSPFNDPSSKLSSLDDAQGPQIKLYQLLEARWVDSLQTYYDFYPLCQLDYIPDNIGVVAVGNTRTDFTFAQVESQDKNQANIYQVAVPHVVAAEPSNARPRSPFASPGDKCWYSVDITNMGNAPITSIEMKVEAEDFTWSTTEEFHDLRPYIQPSEENVKAASAAAESDDDTVIIPSELTTDKREETGILWPGKTRTFLFSFTVPSAKDASYVGFKVSISNCRDNMETDERFREFQDFEPVNGVPVISVADYLDKTFENYTTKFISPAALDISFTEGDQISWSEDLARASYVDAGSGKVVDPDEGHGSGSSDSSGLARTGDDNGLKLLTLGAMAAASAMAAGVASYERRRAENKEGDRE